jgi:hypothetical protein
VRQDFAEEVLQRLCAQKSALQSYVENVKQGRFSNTWVDRILDGSNCKIVD